MKTSLEELTVKIQGNPFGEDPSAYEDGEILITTNFGLGWAILDYSMNRPWCESLSPCCQDRLVMHPVAPNDASCEGCRKALPSSHFFIGEDLNFAPLGPEFLNKETAFRLSSSLDSLLAAMAVEIFSDVVEFLLRNAALWNRIEARAIPLPHIMETLEGFAAEINRG